MIQFRNPSTGLIETFKGLKGNDGKSAYEYATSMGYPGSEEDFAKLMSYDAKEAIEKLLQDMAGIANIEEVTQAEYDALGDEKLSDNVMYCIKDSNTDNEEISAQTVTYDPSFSKFTETNVQSVLDSVFNKIYPVGSIYLSVQNTNPANLFGGTWVQIKDVFLLGAGESYSAGATGGEANHKLTTSEMPSHGHEISSIQVTGYTGWTQLTNNKYDLALKSLGNTSAASHTTNAQSITAYSTGGSSAHNNMPPYLTVYMWKRTA